MNPSLTIAQINGLRTMLRDQADEDERLWIDMIEGETDTFEVAARCLDAIEDDEGADTALAVQIEDRKARRDRLKARISRNRDALAAIMECAKLTKLQLPEATVSLRTLPPKLILNAREAVPNEYTIAKPAPSMDKIKAAFSADDESLPNWLAVEPARPSITVRRN